MEKIDREFVKNVMLEIASDAFKLDADEIDNFEDIELMRDLGCDVSEIAEFLISLENEFGVSIEENEASAITTIGDCINLTYSKILSDGDEIM